MPKPVLSLACPELVEGSKGYFPALLLPLIFSCNSSAPPSETVTKLDSLLTDQHIRSCMPAWDVLTEDTAEGFTQISTFFIENDSLYFHQFTFYDVLLSHDEEYRTDFCIAVPMSLVRSPKYIQVNPDSGEAVCRWIRLNNWDSESVLSSFAGKISFWYRGERDLNRMITFTEDIFFVNTNSPRYPYKMKYKTFDFAVYGDYDILHVPVADSLPRRVYR